jgi:hypothetical protein
MMKKYVNRLRYTGLLLAMAFFFMGFLLLMLIIASPIVSSKKQWGQALETLIQAGLFFLFCYLALLAGIWWQKKTWVMIDSYGLRIHRPHKETRIAWHEIEEIRREQQSFTIKAHGKTIRLPMTWLRPEQSPPITVLDIVFMTTVFGEQPIPLEESVLLQEIIQRASQAKVNLEFPRTRLFQR